MYGGGVKIQNEGLIRNNIIQNTVILQTNLLLAQVEFLVVTSLLSANPHGGVNSFSFFFQDHW